MSDNAHPPVVIMNANELSAPDEFEFLICAVDERFIIIISAVYLVLRDSFSPSDVVMFEYKLE